MQIAMYLCSSFRVTSTQWAEDTISLAILYIYLLFPWSGVFRLQYFVDKLPFDIQLLEI